MGEGKPLELVLGKKFKLEVWEVILQKMALNEVAEFTVDKSVKQIFHELSRFVTVIFIIDISFSLWYSIHLFRKQ